MLAAVPDAFLRYDPARGTEEAYVRNWVLSAARTADRLYGVEQEAGRRADPPDTPGFDPPAPAADPPDAAAVGPAVRARCSAREWAVLDAYYGVSGGPGDGTARHVPALAALLAVPQAEFAGILKATMTRLRAELREE